MPKSIRIFVALLAVLAVSLSVYWFSVSQFHFNVLPYFILLVVIAEVFKVPVIIFGSKEQVSISWSLVISISALIGSGISDAIIVNIVGALVCSLYPNRLPLIKTIYNVSSYVVSITLTYTFFVIFKQTAPTIGAIALLDLVYIPVMYMMINCSVSFIILKLATKNSAEKILVEILGSNIHNFLLFAFIGGIQGYFYKENGFASLLLTSFLIGIVLYSFKKTAEAANERIKELEESNQVSKDLASEVDQTLEQFIHTLTATIDARDPYTYGHSLQVSNYALALAAELKLSEKEIETIKIAGLLHDIGKISIPEAILFKEGRLTDEEYEIMQQHAAIGEEILSDIPRLEEVAKLVGMHHERYNGAGYPKKLKGDEISLGAHILGVADTLDAIVSNRSYKNERTIEDAMNEFKRCRGTMFHPAVVDALFNLRDQLGDESFENSARLVEQSMFTGKVKTNRTLTHKVYTKELKTPHLVRVK